MITFAVAIGVGSVIASPPTAEKVLADAQGQASKEGKTVFLHFGASWCGWCKKLDAFLAQPEIKPVFEKYFVPVTLVVQENEKNKSLENPGGDEVMKKFGGPDGLPYLAFLDRQGGLIVNSKLDGHNIGFPSKPEEIDWFVKMMQKASPKMDQADLKKIEEALRKPAKT
jgi:thiol-disulfide isomerase/thioredoxin